MVGPGYSSRPEAGPSETDPWVKSPYLKAGSLYAAGTGQDENRSEVTALGLNYGLPTRYTSFIAVLKAVPIRTTTARDVDQPLLLPQNVSDLAVGGGMANAPEPELALLLSLLPTTASGLFPLVRHRPGGHRHER